MVDDWWRRIARGHGGDLNKEEIKEIHLFVEQDALRAAAAARRWNFESELAKLREDFKQDEFSKENDTVHAFVYQVMVSHLHMLCWRMG